MEIKANELRIGNLVYFNGKHNEIGVVSEIMKKDFAKVSSYKIGINNRVDIDYDIEKLKPIPLTEDWLLKFGLKQSNLDIKRFYLLGTDLYFFNNKKIIFNPESSSLYVELKYVHQLQNLYFSITQTELEIKNHL